MASDIVFVPAEPGLGHCVRSLAIADQITADSTYDVEFVAGPLCYSYIEEEGFQVHSTPDKDDLQETILEFSTLIRCIKPRIIVSDDHIVAIAIEIISTTSRLVAGLAATAGKRLRARKIACQETRKTRKTAAVSYGPCRDE